jgi:ABC-type nitrate/sulfonate/bicarbonate transport system substrate-binding protein
MSFRRAAPFLLTSLVFVVACASDSTSPPQSAAVTTAPPITNGSISPVTAGAPFPADRCAANKAAGTITYLSSFDFAASASIVDVLVAKQKGYFDAVCLDVKLKASFSTDNYPLIASNEAQFSSGGSFSEVVDYAGRNDAGFVTLAVEGRTGIDELIVKEGASKELADLKGKKIGVKGAITQSVAAMLKQAGLTEGEDYETVLLDGFDPKIHIALPDIVGFPGYKSNEPIQLRAAGIPFQVYDPSTYGIPGSFGVLYTNSTFLGDYPTAAQDFIRASMHGLADALADPNGAAQIAVDMINANGNASHLSPEGEVARWGVESKLVADSTASTLPLGVPDLKLLQNEVKSYADIGLFNGVVPDIGTVVNDSVIKSVYDDAGKVIWPSG